MAERRMFAKTIVLSDQFLDMPMSSRCLYFTLSMFADDDGFVNSPKGIMRQCGASEDDIKILLVKRFLLDFDSGVVVIKDWRINNYLRGDRYKPTQCIEEKQTLVVENTGTYEKNVGIPDTVYPGKVRLGKVSIGKNNNTSDEVQTKKKSSPEKKKNAKAELFDRVDSFTGNGVLREILKKYLTFKLSHCRGYNLDQWNIQLENLSNSLKTDSERIEQVERAYSAGWQQLVYPKNNNGYSGAKPLNFFEQHKDENVFDDNKEYSEIPFED